MNTNLKQVKRQRGEEGQGLVEYALILVLVAVVVIVIMALMGSSLARIYENLACRLQFGADAIGYVQHEQGGWVIEGKLYDYDTHNLIDLNFEGPFNPIADPFVILKNPIDGKLGCNPFDEGDAQTSGDFDANWGD